MKPKNWVAVIITVIVLATVVSLITVKLSDRKNSVVNQTTVKQSQSVYDRVIASGVISACYVPYLPAFIKDPNTGKLSGIFYDALNKAVDNMGLKVDWSVEADWGSMIANLNSGKCDIIGSDSWSNSTRGRSAEFSVPLYYSAINAYVRSSDARFDSDPAIANDPKYTVVYEDGETSQNIVQKQFPNAKTVTVPQTDDVSEMLADVVSNKGDMAFVENTIANQFLKTHPGTIKNVSAAKPVAIYGNVMMIKKGEFEFQTAINNALNELIGNGYVDQLINQYGKDYPGGFYKVAPPYVLPQ
jgi:ABC-type amino acid transport substrate-binding protein